MHSTYSPDQRKEYWLNTLEHLRGNHAKCSFEHPNLKLKISLMDNPARQEQLRIFLSQMAKLVWQTRKDLNTQLCDSFNVVKAHFANKTYAWQLTWPICTMWAIIQLNSPRLWKFELFSGCRSPGLHQGIVQLLREHTMEQIRRNEVRRTSDSQAPERMRRADNREMVGKETLGHEANRASTRRGCGPSIMGTKSGRQGIDLTHSDDPPQISGHLIPIENVINEFPKRRDSLAHANADTEPSERRAIVTAPQETASEDPLSPPAALDSARCKVSMSLRVDSGRST
jgi:hypothetical protein